MTHSDYKEILATFHDCEIRYRDDLPAHVLAVYNLAEERVNAIAGGGGHWDEDTNFPATDWRHEVADGNTRLGYHEWVARQHELYEGTIEGEFPPL